jgi:hypothetical protein
VLHAAPIKTKRKKAIMIRLEEEEEEEETVNQIQLVSSERRGTSPPTT